MAIDRNGLDYSMDTPEQRALRTIRDYNRTATRLWEQGNNSGDPSMLEQCEAAVEGWQAVAEKLAAKYGWRIEYPGLNWRVLNAEGIEVHP